MGILDSLILSESSKRAATTDQKVQLRHKMATSLDQQIAAATCETKGEVYAVEVEKWIVTDKTTGAKERRKVQTIQRKMWYRDASNKVMLELRLGHKPLKIGNKSSIQVGDLSNLVPILEKVKAAVMAGELDQAMKEISDNRKRAKKAAITTVTPVATPPTKPETTTTAAVVSLTAAPKTATK